MRNIILSVLLWLGCARAFGAAGDITGAWITTNGWSLRIRVSGVATNGLIDTGLGTNRTELHLAKAVVNLTSQALTTNLQVTTIPVTLYGQEPMRYPYPGDALVDTVADGTDAIIHVALHDYVYSGDSNLVLTVGSGLYTATNAGPTVVSSAAGSVAVTNLSVMPYPAPPANWTTLKRLLLTNDVYTLKMFGIDRHAGADGLPGANMGQPLKAVVFTLSDGSTTLTNIQTQAGRDFGEAYDQAVVCEYMARFTNSLLSQGAVLSGNFWAIPFRGTNATWTGDGVNGESSTRYTTIRFVNDPNFRANITNSYGITIARVSTNGNNSTGVAQRYRDYIVSPTTNFFADHNAAARAIVASNNTAGFLASTRNDLGGGIIYTMEGHYALTGSGTTVTGNMPDTYLTITRDPSAARENVVFDGTSGTVQFRKRTQFCDVSLMKTNTSYQFSAEDSLVWRRCYLDQGTSNYGSSCTNIDIVECTITNFPPITPVGGPQTVRLFRGNIMLRWRGNVTGTTVIGNLALYTNGPSQNQQILYLDRTGTLEDCTNGVMVAFNRFYGVNQSLNHGIDALANADNVVTGFCLVQNIVEATGDGVSCVLNLGNSTHGSFRNIVEVNNDWLGKYIGHYNDQTNTVYYELGARRGNVVLNDNFKTDTFTVANGARTNNWSEYMGVGMSDNLFAEIDNVGATASFLHKSPGLRSVQFPSPTTNAIMKFFAGNYYYLGAPARTDTPGDYRFHSTSFAQHLSNGRRGLWVLPYDIFGMVRGPYDPPGAVVGGKSSNLGGF